MPLGEDRRALLKELTILRYLYSPITEMPDFEAKVCPILTYYQLPFTSIWEVVTRSTTYLLRLYSLGKDIIILKKKEKPRQKR